MNKVFRIVLIAIVFCFFLPASGFSVGAEDDDRIDYDEAWGLVQKAYELYLSLHSLPDYFPPNLENKLGFEYESHKYDGSVYTVVREGKYHSVEEISKYANSIFTEDIAQYVLICGESTPLRMERDESGKIISPLITLPDKPQDMFHAFAMDYNLFSLKKSFYHEYFDLFPSARTVGFTEESNGGGAASFRLTVYQGTFSEVTYQMPGTVSVSFIKTKSGWRIGDCGFFSGICFDYDNTGFVPKFTGDLHDVLSLRGAAVADLSLENADKSGMKVQIRLFIPEKPSDSHRKTDIKSYFIEYNNDSVRYALDCFEFLNEKNGEWERIRIDAEYVRENNELRLVGGELLNLINGKTTVTPYTGPVILFEEDQGLSPSTGDTNPLLFSFLSLVGLICLSGLSAAHLKSRRRDLQTDDTNIVIDSHKCQAFFRRL
jgi:hypothetical protein